MNFLKLSLFSLLVVAFAACKKDDDSPTCTPADWVGTYEGTTDCGGTDDEDVTVTITAVGTDSIVVQYATASLTTTYDAIAPTNCTINESGTDAGLTFTVDATLDGDKLTIKETLSGSVDFTCDLTATRQ